MALVVPRLGVVDLHFAWASCRLHLHGQAGLDICRHGCDVACNNHAQIEHDAEKIVQLAQTADPRTNPEVAQFRLEVQEKLASVNTVPEAGSISTIICDIAAKHFPKQTQSSSKIVRWQQPHVQEGIKDMWKAWRQYRSNTKDTTLRAILGRWKTWTRYNQLYTKHKERCRTTKKTYILEQMCIAERAAQSHNQRLLYQVIRTLAPKARRNRPQLRDAQGHMMTRSEEATCFHQHFTTKFTATIDALMKLDGLVFQPTYAVEAAPEGPLLHSSTLEQHLNKAPLRKAVPPGHPPSAIWRLCSDITAAQVCRVLDDKWCQRPTAVLYHKDGRTHTWSCCASRRKPERKQATTDPLVFRTN